MNDKKYLIYRIVNIESGKSYIGKHETLEENDKYFGSGIALKDAIKRYGKDKFKKEIIEYCKETKELSEREKYWIKEFNSIVPNGYNISLGGNGGDNITNNPNKEQILEKMRNTKRRRATNSEKKDRRNRMKGSKLKPHKKIKCEYCESEISKANYQRWHGDFCKKNPEMKIKELKKSFCEFCLKITNPVDFSINHGEYCEMNPNKKTREAIKIECEHCNKKITQKNYVMHHGNSCKKNPIFLKDSDLFKKTNSYIITKSITDKRKSNNKKDSEETRRKKGESRRGKTVSEDVKKKMSDSCKERWKRDKSNINPFTCEHCKKKILLKMNYLKWHGDKCKEKHRRDSILLPEDTYRK